MIKRIALLLTLAAAPAFAGTGVQVFQSRAAGPWVGAIADQPPCGDGVPMLFLATDGTTSTDCATGGGTSEGLCLCLDGTWAAVGAGGGASTLDDLTDVSTAGAVSGDALVSDGAGAWSPGVPSIEGAAGVAATPQLINYSGDAYTQLESDCVPSGDPGGPLTLNCQDGTGYASIADEGAFPPLEPRAQLNFIGASVNCADNAGMSRTDCTLTDADTAAGYGFTGLDLDLVTGTVGAAGLYGQWDANGDLIGASVGVTDLADDATCSGLDVVRRNAGDTAFECGAAAGGGIGGSTGATDNALLRADGPGGATLQNSGFVVNDTGQLLAPAVAFQTPNISSELGPTTGFNLGRTGAVNDIEVDIGGARMWFWEGTGGALSSVSTGTGCYLRANGGHAAATPAWSFRNDQNTGVRTAAGDTDTAFLVAGGSDSLGWSTTEVTNLRDILSLTPRATAPAACTITPDVDIYVDNSGGIAVCICTAANTWTMWFPPSPTTENCT